MAKDRNKELTKEKKPLKAKQSKNNRLALNKLNAADRQVIAPPLCFTFYLCGGRAVPCSNPRPPPEGERVRKPTPASSVREPEDQIRSRPSSGKQDSDLPTAAGAGAHGVEQCNYTGELMRPAE